MDILLLVGRLAIHAWRRESKDELVTTKRSQESLGAELKIRWNGAVLGQLIRQNTGVRQAALRLQSLFMVTSFLNACAEREFVLGENCRILATLLIMLRMHLEK